MINYSIIIPHKNSFTSLLRLCDSIPNNNDIQIIIIDDCSDLNVLNEIKKNRFNNNVAHLCIDTRKASHGASPATFLNFSSGFPGERHCDL